MRAIELRALCSAAYQEALAESRREFGGCLRSRGRFFYALEARGNNVAPRYEAEMCPWDGSQRQLDREIRIAQDAGYIGLCVQGGIDYAECVRDFADGCYDPFVAEWAVDVEMN